jgi:transposase
MIAAMLPTLANSQLRVFLYAKHVDLRKSYDGLFAIVQSEFQRDLRLGDLFLFINRRGDQVKLIYWDGDGLAIWMKRLERGTFQRPSRANDGKQVEMDATELSLLLSGIDLDSAKRRKRYALDDTIRDKLRDSASSRPK